MSKSISTTPPSILPHSVRYHKVEFTGLVTGVALIAITFILQNQDTISSCVFVGMISGGSLLSFVSLIVLVRRYYEKYHFTKSDAAAFTKNSIVEIFITGNGQYMFSSINNDIEKKLRDFIKGKLSLKGKFGFNYTIGNSDLSCDFYGNTVNQIMGQILYSLRAIHCGKKSIIETHATDIRDFRLRSQSVEFSSLRLQTEAKSPR